MKLRNKLIPLMSVLAATGTAAPIVTSCSSMSGLVDITKAYVPTIAKAPTSPLIFNDTQAQDLYFSHLADNPEILKQDVLNYEAAKLPNRINRIEHWDDSENYFDLESPQTYVCSNVKAGVNVRNISTRRVSIVENEKEKIFYTISCVLEYAFNYTATSVDGTYAYTSNLTFRAALNDIPTEVYGDVIYNPTTDDETIKWKVSNNFLKSNYLNAVTGWSYTFNEENTVSETYIDTNGIKKTISNDYSRDGIINRESQIKAITTSGQEYYDEILSFESYHLSDLLAEQSGVAKPVVNDEGCIEGTVKYETIREYDPEDTKWTTNCGALIELSNDVVEKASQYKYNFLLTSWYGNNSVENIPYDVETASPYENIKPDSDPGIYYELVQSQATGTVETALTNPAYYGKSSSYEGFTIKNNKLIPSSDILYVRADDGFSSELADYTPNWEPDYHLYFEYFYPGVTYGFYATNELGPNPADYLEYTFTVDENSNGIWLDLTVIE